MALPLLYEIANLIILDPSRRLNRLYVAHSQPFYYTLFWGNWQGGGIRASLRLDEKRARKPFGQPGQRAANPG